MASSLKAGRLEGVGEGVGIRLLSLQGCRTPPGVACRGTAGARAVSYTHQTLPTNREA